MDGSQSPALQRETVDDPGGDAATARLIERIDALEAAMSQVTDLLEQAPTVVATVTDIADESVRRAGRRGVDMDQRLHTALSLLERITEPDMVSALNRLMDLAEGGDAMLATLGDMADETARRLDFDGRARAGGALLERATRPEVTDQLGDMLDTLIDAEGGMLHPAAVQTLGVAAQALVAAQGEPPRRATPWQAFRAARDPQLQRALGFMLEFGKQFARRLDS